MRIIGRVLLKEAAGRYADAVNAIAMWHKYRLIAGSIIRARAIRTRRAYDKALREVEELTLRGAARSEAQTEYYRVFCALLGDYERAVGVDQWPKMAPLDALAELMDLQGVTQSEIAIVLGDRAAASSILSGRRGISKTQAKKLAALFYVNVGIFI